jgi:hypothetical protein
MTTQRIEEIIQEWEKEGGDSHPEEPRLPLHPEFFYRISGEWKGWNHFLNTPISSHHYQENLAADEIENKAWLIYKKRLN